MAALATALGACSGNKAVRGDVGFIEGFFGAVVADEPRAAEAGRDVLTSGGSAADAAVAMYFTMAATLPSAASLGSGGVCLIHDARKRAVEAIVFPLVPAAGSTRGYDVAVPMAARGMALLHARHGRAPWALLVANGERLARFGAPVSRALSRDLQAGAWLIGADPVARRIYDKGGGVAVTEGDIFRQDDLGATLGIIRARGGGDLYQGPLARQLSTAVQQAGGGLTLANLRDAVPRVVQPLQVRFGQHTVSFAPTPFSGGQAAASAFQNGGGGVGGPFEGGEAGFVAVDRDGNAVSCTVTMNQLFGARRVAPGTGIMMGALAAACRRRRRCWSATSRTANSARRCGLGRRRRAGRAGRRRAHRPDEPWPPGRRGRRHQRRRAQHLLLFDRAEAGSPFVPGARRSARQWPGADRRQVGPVQERTP